MNQTGVQIQEPKGKMGMLLVGLGAVSTTVIAGVEAVKRGLGKPIGSLTQMGTIRLGKRTENRVPRIQDFVPLAGLDDLVFGAWDIFPDNAYEAAVEAGVLEKDLLETLRPELEAIRPMKGVFDPRFVKRLHGTHIKEGSTKWDLAQELMEEIQRFQQDNGIDRCVMVWCGSTEIHMKIEEPHQSLESLEHAMKNDGVDIPSSMVYAYAALSLGIPFANGAPNLTLDVPALLELAESNRVPVCGKDFKTGQTLMKTILAPGLKADDRPVRMVLDEHPRQPRRRGAGRSRVVQDEGAEQALCAGAHPPAAPVPGSL
jgi:myo-inositol-1-phosphate synthase